MIFKFFQLSLILIVVNYGLWTMDYGLLRADEKQWSAGGDGLSWEDSANWFPQVVPTASDDVSIDATNASVLAAKTFNARSLILGGREESAFTTADFVYGAIAPNKNTDNALYIKKDGSITLKGAGDITLKGAFKNSEESLPAEPAFMFSAE